ncbi:NYN domain-containing protein [Lysobacter sp. A6]|uniref:NYN domain-containing protein n=1 Tax=Noviluteimonas lactosilytica TaxID=2888523 RepID=A0ABS8JHE7_9GAMM|nr:NYN domain-containing protein [Lysobacter lactosilyticus]MCC8363031.1 NYN domain-containing protein [Lysobacter lactosilyticus]
MASLPTAVYVDGYNLYYGRLRGTCCKWLDLVALFERLLHEQSPAATLDRLRYFSAPALARFATHGQASVEAQQDYHRALLKLHAHRLSITLGTHSFDRTGTLLPRFVDRMTYDRRDRIRVWKIEEKMTDVNLALAMYRDACSGEFEQLVLCSNDRDAAPALQSVRADFPNITLGVVAPRWPSESGTEALRKVAGPLARSADWTRHHLLDQELSNALLPSIIHTGRKPIRRPPHW